MLKGIQLMKNEIVIVEMTEPERLCWLKTNRITHDGRGLSLDWYGHSGGGRRQTTVVSDRDSAKQNGVRRNPPLRRSMRCVVAQIVCDGRLKVCLG